MKKSRLFGKLKRVKNAKHDKPGKKIGKRPKAKPSKNRRRIP